MADITTARVATAPVLDVLDWLGGSTDGDRFGGRPIDSVIGNHDPQQLFGLTLRQVDES